MRVAVSGGDSHCSGVTSWHQLSAFIRDWNTSLIHSSLQLLPISRAFSRHLKPTADACFAALKYKLNVQSFEAYGRQVEEERRHKEEGAGGDGEDAGTEARSSTSSQAGNGPAAKGTGVAATDEASGRSQGAHGVGCAVS